MELWSFIVVIGLKFLFRTPEHLHLVLDVDPDEAIGTGHIGVEHKGVVQLVGDYLLARRVPEETGVERVALRLGKGQTQEGEQDELDHSMIIYYAKRI